MTADATIIVAFDGDDDNNSDRDHEGGGSHDENWFLHD